MTAAGALDLRALLISQYDQQQKQADAAIAAQLKEKEKLLPGHKFRPTKPLRPTADAVEISWFDRVTGSAELLRQPLYRLTVYRKTK
jgi:hypothetical protein